MTPGQQQRHSRNLSIIHDAKTGKNCTVESLAVKYGLSATHIRNICAMGGVCITSFQAHKRPAKFAILADLQRGKSSKQISHDRFVSHTYVLIVQRQAKAAGVLTTLADYQQRIAELLQRGNASVAATDNRKA